LPAEIFLNQSAIAYPDLHYIMGVLGAWHLQNFDATPRASTYGTGGTMQFSLEELRL
jgi:hypothetical protein